MTPGHKKKVWIVPVALIFVILIAACFSVFNCPRVIEMSRSLAISDIQTLRTQLMAYEAANGFFPTTEQGLQALVIRPVAAPNPRNWRRLMDKVPRDPWGEPYVYRFEDRNVYSKGRSDPIQLTIFSLGPDRIESGDDIHPSK